MQPCALFSLVATFLLLSEANCSTDFQVRLGEGGRSSAGRAAALLKQGREACCLGFLVFYGCVYFYLIFFSCK